MAIGGKASPPPAFRTFCQQHPSECRPTDRRAGPMVLTAERYRELEAINSYVNGSLREVSDYEQHGQEDVWTVPGQQGDCEDFALLKRKLLIARGWPSSALLLTVAATSSGEGHAVLTVVTDRGDYVLDNKTSRIRLWTDTGYMFFTRQSASDPRHWVAVRGGVPGQFAAETRNPLRTSGR